MKNKKIFAAMLLAVVAFLFTACPQTAKKSNKSDNTSITLNAEQKMAYDYFITSAETEASMEEFSADQVAEIIKAHNDDIKPLKLKIMDTTPGRPVAKGTKAAALRARFRPVTF